MSESSVSERIRYYLEQLRRSQEKYASSASKAGSGKGQASGTGVNTRASLSYIFPWLPEEIYAVALRLKDAFEEKV